MEYLKPGAVVEILADCPGPMEDVPALVKQAGGEVLAIECPRPGEWKITVKI
ncbi:MAG: sulfurtransferase TusA family protein [Thermodesulfobacteriota bacterium]